MADDLMDFSEASLIVEQDENEAPAQRAPALVQSPVIVNSILKQSTKDNLIQLYTPVQKPEKGRLKVHFGHDSLLQTPNVRQVKIKMDEVLPIKEEGEIATKGVKFAVEDKENVSVEPQNADVTKKDTSEPSEVPEHIVNGKSGEIANKDDVDSHINSAESGLEVSAMEVSICETQAPEKAVDPADDILLQAEMLLRSLQGGVSGLTETSPVKSMEKSQNAKKDVEKACSEEKVEEKPETTVATESHSAQEVAVTEIVKTESDQKVKTESDQKELVTVSENADTNDSSKEELQIGGSNEEEPMECEEAMEVDEEDDEIVFNIGKNKTQETKSSEIIEENVESQIEKSEVEEKISEETASEVPTGNNEEHNCNRSNDSPSSRNEKIKTSPSSPNNLENDAKNEVSDKEESESNLSKNVSEHVETPEFKDETAAATPKSADDIKDKQAEVNKVKGPNSKKTGEDSSDEEFMSADEDMEVDEVKTPAKISVIDSNVKQDIKEEPKQDSPERIPPKVGYNLNFDDLDSMDPFATKKSIVNSPDVGTQTKQEEKMNEDNKEKVSTVDVDVSDVEKTENFKSANTSPEKSAPPRAEIILSPNAALVDEVCRDKTAGDIFEERPDCLLLDDVKHINESESILQNEKHKSDAKKEIDFDSIDPFKPKLQIANTPDKVKQEGETQLNIDDPFQGSHQIISTPDKSEVKETCEDTKAESFNTVKAVEDEDIQKQTLDQPNTDNDRPVTPHKKVTEDKQVEASPPLPVSKGVYDLDALDLDDIGPFKPSKQMTNSPSVTSDQSKVDEVDPFKPKKQVQNSPVGEKKNDELKPEENDPFKPKKQMMNSPVCKQEVTEVMESKTGDADQDKALDEVTDPFRPKAQIENSPTKLIDNICGDENDSVEQMAPIQNSPACKVSDDKVNTLNFESLVDTDPFKPKSQIQNSPTGKVEATANTLDQENSDCVDPFKSKTQLQNSPPGKVTVQPDLDTVEDPFKPKNQMQNSPQIKKPDSEINKTEPEKTEITCITADKAENNIDPFAEVDPVTSMKQLEVAPPAMSESKTDPFADLIPFNTKSKVANTPEKAEKEAEDQGLDNFANIDPFISKNKIANSPDLETIEENPFVTKSRVATTPTKQDDPFSQEIELPTTPLKDPTELPDGLGDVFEVQGVTRRGQEMSQSDIFGDIDDTQFVSASQVFNDPAAWEMLEKLGSATSNTAESALSRMSLYVKFDPLVDEAPAVNPRRISIRVSQLEKVKEYGLDETLLLLGTPPKKRRQSLTASQARVTPSGAKLSSLALVSEPDRKLESEAVAPGGVDLILAYSPKEKKQQEKNGVNLDGHVMGLLDDVDDPIESANLFQELKYTDADVKKMQRENKLAMQGILINKDKEWCKKEKQWEQKYSELSKKCKQIKEDRDKLERAFLSLEQTAYEIAAAREASEKKVQELKNEKEQALEDMQAVETSFSHLHKRFEKAKTVILSMQKNEETLKKYVSESQEKQKKMNEKFHTLEKTSQEKLTTSKHEIEKLQQQRDSVQSKFDAQMKIMQIKIENLDTSIQRKTEENKQLTEICDNLLSKVGQ